MTAEACTLRLLQIISSVAEHHSNLVPWQLIAQRTGAVIKHVKLTENNQELDMQVRGSTGGSTGGSSTGAVRPPLVVMFSRSFLFLVAFSSCSPAACTCLPRKQPAIVCSMRVHKQQA